MKILALDSSGLVASAAVVEDDVLIAEYTTDYKKTHSQTLLPMLDEIRQMVDLDLHTIDAIAISAGPGSFTGVRIGVSTAKGIADAKNIPCVGVSSLAGAAWNVAPLTDRLICPVMDARRGQLYNALFDYTGGTLHRLTPDRAISMEDLKKELISLGKSVLLVGDGTQICYNNFSLSDELDVTAAPSGLVYPCAWGAAMEAYHLAQEGKMVSAAALLPSYLRQPQAVRERLAREAEQAAKSSMKKE